MAAKLTVTFFVVALVTKGGVLASGFFPAPVVAPAPVLAPAPVVAPAPLLAKVSDATIDPNPAYSFAYDVEDTLTGDSKGQVESRANGVVRGQYSVADPDGTRRIVDYYADPVHGFNAVVRRVPLGVAVAPVVAKAVAPVAPAIISAPVAPVARALAPVPAVAPALPFAAAAVPAVAPAFPFAAPFPAVSPFLTRASVLPAAPAVVPAAPGPAYLPTAPARFASPYLAAPPLPSGLRSLVTPYAAGPAPLAVGTGVAAPYLGYPAY